ncbi:MAG: FAD:protein FMN transferase [Synergistaceae bacterium]|jgi:thiamine biosynthesis lipoprotein|nr:FAD:protein FMN transferase [Synergistaceae bacterium]MDD3319497.1 FAD:protein FMN transferase [Synergistaceae bacterium]NLW60890.1 FAD:protein FMN transferase [Synergistaceae bacterium]
MSIKIHLPRSIIYLGTAAVTLILIIFLYSANRDNGSRSLQKAQRESYRLGTIVRITLYGDDSKKLNNVLDLSMKEIERLENLLSVNIPSSDVSLVNRASGEYPVKVSEEAGSLLERAIEWSERTGGAFDPTVGKIVKLWGIGTESAAVPDPEQLKEAVDMTDFRKVSVLHEVNGTFVQTAKGQRIDLGGIAKGYITEKVKALLINEGVSSALIDLGGNIAVFGSSPKPGKWKLGLQHPFMPRGEYFGIAEVSDVSVVTSGAYERYFESGGIRYHHIFDTATGYPALSDLASVTIISEDSTDADALSTALFVMGFERGISLLRELKNVEAVLVAKKTEGTIVYVTKGLSKGFLLKDPAMKKAPEVQ